MKTMTIRNIPGEVADFISEKAATEGRSVNAMTVALLTKAAGLDTPRPKRRDLSWLAGSWTAQEARRFDASVAVCRRINPEDWK